MDNIVCGNLHRSEVAGAQKGQVALLDFVFDLGEGFHKLGQFRFFL